MLTLRVNKDTGALIALDAAGYPSGPLAVKRRDTVEVAVNLFTAAGAASTFTGGTLSIGVKLSGAYTGDLLASAVLTLSGGTYTGSVSLNNDAVNTGVFAAIGLPPVAPDFANAVIELIHSSGWSSESIPLRVNNDYITGDEPDPGTSTSALTAALAERLIFRSALIGGTGAALDGVATTTLATMTPCLVSQAGVLSMWQLQVWDGLTAEDTAAGLVLPDDANAITNAKFWVRLS